MDLRWFRLAWHRLSLIMDLRWFRLAWHRLWKPLLISALVLVVLTCGLLGLSGGSSRAGVRLKVRVSNGTSDEIHVCLCSDDTDLRPAAVAIKSAHMNAASPERLFFHFITTPELAPVFQELFAIYLVGISVEVHADAELQGKIASSISFRNTSRARLILASPFNFAPFYLHEYLAIRKTKGKEVKVPDRLIYLDTDTLIMGDLAELQEIDLEGQPCGAVKYCLQTMDNYIDFHVVEELGYTNYDPKACIANRGLLVIDVQRWIRFDLTGKIEMWLGHYRDSKADLWLGGMSQPPWLLAMNGNFLELSDEWNCNSLGRDSMSSEEAQSLRQSGFDHAALRSIGAKYGEYGGVTPYVVSCSATGKMLHFNGAVKPWAVGKIPLGQKLPACALPENMPPIKFEWEANVRVLCKPMKFVNCADLWASYISEDVACALRDFNQEWVEDEDLWQKNLEDAKRTQKAMDDAAKQEVEKREMEDRKQRESTQRRRTRQRDS
ncbi:unnamed protein product [Polarella glacialis]|uniref:Hexosyltransferase n=1 Tax=Polarella glacialis TaxID=89957 RepID=A0A813G5E0_POLGL|nr:unnamed protein product [Polarella glacialis]